MDPDESKKPLLLIFSIINEQKSLYLCDIAFNNIKEYCIIIENLNELRYKKFIQYMAKSRDIRKDKKKTPQMTAKEKRQAKRDKKNR